MAEALDIKWIHLEETLKNFAEYFIQLAKDNLQANGSIASEDLYNSLDMKNVIIQIEEDYYSVSISLEDYWRYVEEGTGPEHKPDARSAYWPNVDAIKNWITVKRLPTVDVDSTAFLISRAIAGKSPNQAQLANPQGGIIAKPFFEPAKQETIERFELEIELAIDEDIRVFVEESVENFLIKKFREIF